MVDIMLSALGPTCLAHIGAQATNLLGELRTTAHESGRRPADIRAVLVKPDALGHHLHILLLETGVAAMLAFLGTTDTGVDARLKILMRHEFSPSASGYKKRSYELRSAKNP
jgi:hypothetical protein